MRRTVEERAQQFSDDQVEGEIERQVRETTRRERGDFKGVHPCPASSGDVPDEQEARLVVLRPHATHKSKDRASPALEAAGDILANRGGSPRQHRNTLVFLAADREAMESLKQETRRLLAWQSVSRDEDALNLDAHQRREASEGEKESEKAVQLRFNEAWRWLLVPSQQAENGNVGSLEWEIAQATGNGDSIVVRASLRMLASEHLIVRWSPALLKMELDRWFWKNQAHVPVKKVWDALSAYCYLPRLRDQTVFVAAIQDGLASGDYFGYATSVSADGRYEGLKLGTAAPAIYVDAASVLVKPDVARAQFAIVHTEPAALELEPGTVSGAPPISGISGSSEAPRRPRLPSRFYGTVEIDPDRAGRDMGKVTEEVLQHFTTLPGGKVKVRVEIEAEVPEGVSADLQRAITENCQTLRFKSHGFEES